MPSRHWISPTLASVLLALVGAEPGLGRDPECRPATGPGSQLITVEAATARTTYASLRLWRREERCWRPVAGPWTARVGRNGLSGSRREGDGTTPTGTYTIGRVMYGIASDPGVRYRYRRLVCGDYWVEDAGSPSYNTFQHVRCGTRPPFRVTGERLWEYTAAYRHLAVIEFNMRPVVPGRGSGIFLHVGTGRPTNGCVSLPLPHLVHMLRWLRPGREPRISISVR
jgi:L,D-peptidoglycan transpeptidase YkuD (ErfK/YbiS/YcfS/YnhG family)